MESNLQKMIDDGWTRDRDEEKRMGLVTGVSEIYTISGQGETQQYAIYSHAQHEVVTKYSKARK